MITSELGTEDTDEKHYPEGPYMKIDWNNPLATPLSYVGFSVQDGLYLAGDVVDAAWEERKINLRTWETYITDAPVKFWYLDSPIAAIVRGYKAERTYECNSNADDILPADKDEMVILEQFGYTCVAHDHGYDPSILTETGTDWWLSPGCQKLAGDEWRTKCALMFNDDWDKEKGDLFYVIRDLAVAFVTVGHNHFWEYIRGCHVYCTTSGSYLTTSP